MKEIKFRKEFTKRAEGLLGMATGNNRGEMKVYEDEGGVHVVYQHQRTKAILTWGGSEGAKGCEGFEVAFHDAIRNGRFLSK